MSNTVSCYFQLVSMVALHIHFMVSLRRDSCSLAEIPKYGPVRSSHVNSVANPLSIPRRRVSPSPAVFLEHPSTNGLGFDPFGLVQQATVELSQAFFSEDFPRRGVWNHFVRSTTISYHLPYTVVP